MRRVLRTACLPKGCDVRRRIRSAGSGRIPAEPRDARCCLHDFALLFWVTLRAVAADAKIQPQTRIGEIGHGIEQLEENNTLSRIQHHDSPKVGNQLFSWLKHDAGDRNHHEVGLAFWQTWVDLRGVGKACANRLHHSPSADAKAPQHCRQSKTQRHRQPIQQPKQMRFA